jgi:hypothetical protein
MRVIGVNPLKGCIYYAEADGSPFSVVDRNRIIFEDSPTGLVTLADELKALFESARDQEVAKVLICGRSTFSSSAEAIKGEAVVELVACRKSLEVVTVSPHRLKKVLGGDDTWQNLAAMKLNGSKKEPYWSQGMNGAFAAAFSGCVP